MMPPEQYPGEGEQPRDLEPGKNFNLFTNKEAFFGLLGVVVDLAVTNPISSTMSDSAFESLGASAATGVAVSIIYRLTRPKASRIWHYAAELAEQNERQMKVKRLERVVAKSMSEFDQEFSNGQYGPDYLVQDTSERLKYLED